MIGIGDPCMELGGVAPGLLPNALQSISQLHSHTPKVQQPTFSGSVSTYVPNKANPFVLVHRRQTANIGKLVMGILPFV